MADPGRMIETRCERGVTTHATYCRGGTAILSSDMLVRWVPCALGLLPRCATADRPASGRIGSATDTRTVTADRPAMVPDLLSAAYSTHTRHCALVYLHVAVVASVGCRLLRCLAVLTTSCSVTVSSSSRCDLRRAAATDSPAFHPLLSSPLSSSPLSSLLPSVLLRRATFAAAAAQLLRTRKSQSGLQCLELVVTTHHCVVRIQTDRGGRGGRGRGEVGVGEEERGERRRVGWSGPWGGGRVAEGREEGRCSRGAAAGMWRSVGPWKHGCCRLATCLRPPAL